MSAFRHIDIVSVSYRSTMAISTHLYFEGQITQKYRAKVTAED